jgi:hypothetical protein
MGGILNLPLCKTNNYQLIMPKRKSVNHFGKLAIGLTILAQTADAQNTSSYAQRLGWKKDDRVIMFHIDDAGMSRESNEGTMQALANGVATSASVMMPCPWVSDFADYLHQNPGLDIGLHLTHTSEWKGYRWGPLSGASVVPGLSDHHGNLWDNVADVVAHATPQEIEIEVSTQIKKARMMGLEPTHLDTHMGVLWASADYLEVYLRTAINEHIPVLFPAGNLTWVEKSLHNSPLAGFKALVTVDAPDSVILEKVRETGERLWAAGLPVVDDLHLLSYDWLSPGGLKPMDVHLKDFKTEKFKQLLLSLKPGITVILIHCSEAGEHFNSISDSGHTRRADLLAMKNQGLKDFITQHGFITTSWKELQQRRDQLKP